MTSTQAATDAPTRAEKTAALLAKLKQGVAAIVTGDDWKRMLAMQSRFHSYSFRNVIAIVMQQPGATRVAGFQAWKAMGRSVKKGEKGIAILAPCVRKAEASEGSADEAGEGRGSRMFFRVAYVFDVSQTEGDPLPSVATTLAGDDEAAAATFDRLRAFAEEKLGIPVSFEPMPGGAHGYLSRIERRIAICEGLSPLQSAKTLAHEIAHAVLHLDEKDSHERTVMEVEAESTAFVVLDALGFDTSAYSFGYVAGWSDAAENTPDPIGKAGANVARASKVILDALLDDNDDDVVDEDAAHAA